MKRMDKTILLLLAAACICACSKDSSEGSLVPADDNAPVEIVLNGGISAVMTKADPAETATCRIAAWESKAGSVSNYSSTAWENGSTSVSSTSGAITLNPARQYNADGDTKTYIKGWAPDIASTNGKVSFTTTDGSVDVLYTGDAISGSKTDKFSSSRPLTFKHKTSKLIFKVQAGTGLAANTTLTNIWVKGARVPKEINLATDSVTFQPAASELAAYGLTSGTAINSTAADAGSLMIAPAEPVVLKVQTSNATYDDVVLKTDNVNIQLAEGNAYTVTLTFGQPGIELTSSITPWTSQSHNQSIQ